MEEIRSVLTSELTVVEIKFVIVLLEYSDVENPVSEAVAVVCTGLVQLGIVNEVAAFVENGFVVWVKVCLSDDAGKDKDVYRRSDTGCNVCKDVCVSRGTLDGEYEIAV